MKNNKDGKENRGRSFYGVIRQVSLRRGHLNRNLDKVRKETKQILIILPAFPSCLLKDFAPTNVPSVSLFSPLSTCFLTSIQICLIYSILKIIKCLSIYFILDLISLSKIHPTPLIYFPLQPKSSKQFSIPKVFFPFHLFSNPHQPGLNFTIQGNSFSKLSVTFLFLLPKPILGFRLPTVLDTVDSS